MSNGNLFPELSSDPQPETNPDELAPDPSIIATSTNPGPVPVVSERTAPFQQPLPPPILPQAEVALIVSPEVINPIISDGSLPPNLPPEDPTALTPTPRGRRSGKFWLWAAPALLLVLIMFGIGARSFIMGGIANVSMDVVRPKSGENVFLNQPVTVVARIRSSNGWSKANFYVNNQIMQSVPGQKAEYDQELTFTWTPSSEGANMLRVQVTNLKGDQTATEDVAVMVVRGESGATITPPPNASATITLTPTKGPSPTPCTDLFEITNESGLVQGTKLDVAKPFTKSWTLKNVGSCTWEKYKFVFVSGSLLGATTPLQVPITETGGTATLNLNLTSPSIAGNFIGKWRVQNSRGDLFGPEMVYGLVVPSPTPTITPTKTDTPTPRPTSTPRPSYTPRFTFTAIATIAPTSTSTSVPSVTSTPTFTPTSPSTDTLVPTETPTQTNPPTPTETPTETLTPTNQMVITEEYTETPGTLLYRTKVVTWTPIPPTPTATPQPNPKNPKPVTPTSAPIPTPAKYNYSDDFSDNTSGWPIGSTNDSTYGYVDGAYAIGINTRNFLQPIVPNDYLGTGDALIEVDVWKNTSSDTGNIGIVCGFLDYKNYFIMGISTDGSVGVYQIKDEKVLTLFHEAGQFSPTDRYHLIANCQNGHFTLDVDGKILIDLIDPALTSNGGVGIYGRSLQTGSFMFNFDNFKVEQADQIAAILFGKLSSTPMLPVGIRLKNANPKNQRK